MRDHMKLAEIKKQTKTNENGFISFNFSVYFWRFTFFFFVLFMFGFTKIIRRLTMNDSTVFK